MNSPVTLYEIQDEAAWITLNRPESRNALSAALVNELYAHLQSAEADPGVRCIVITGSGSAFCAGADLKAPPGQAIDGRASVPYHTLLAGIQDCAKPVLAAVNGAAFAGGLGLVAAADIVIIDEDATCSFSEVRIGVIPAVISVVCLPKLGAHQGMRLFLTGARFSGREAVTLGLAHRAAPGAEVRRETIREVEMIRRGGPDAVRECKKLVRRIPGRARDLDFETTGEWSLRMFNSEQAAEGMAAFREKRDPAWVQDS